MAQVELDACRVWCDDCEAFHALKDCKVMAYRKGAGYVCPRSPDYCPSILFSQGVTLDA